MKPSNPPETAYLKFNVSGVSGAAVQSATLRVNALSGLAWGFDAYTTASTWTETALTSQNAPAPGTKLGSFPSGALTGWISVDVTAAVTADGTYSFALVGTYWQEISLSAREAGATAPQLVVTTSGPPPPPDTQPPTTPGNLTATARRRLRHPLVVGRHRQRRRHRLQRLPRIDAGFTPSPGNRIAQPTSTGYTDGGLAAGTYYYRVAARDAAGNESPATAEASATVAGGGVRARPRCRPPRRRRHRRRRLRRSLGPPNRAHRGGTSST